MSANSDSNMALAVAGQTTMVNGTTGNATTVTMTSSGSGCARAENVKFVRVN